MKKSIILIGFLAFMLSLGGMAYGQGGMDGSGSQGAMGGTGSDVSSQGAMQGKVDVNTASTKELESIPGMTRSMARDIVKYRDQNGPFTSTDELLNVKGMDKQKLDKIRSSITVGGASGTEPAIPGGMDGGTSGGTDGSPSGY